MRMLAAVLLVLVLSGCTAPIGDPREPVTSPTAAIPEPPVPTAPAWEPDLTLVREFPDENGEAVSCTLFRRVVPVEPSSPVAEQVALAQQFLRDGDWSTAEVTLDQLPPDEVDSRRAQGVSDPELYAMVLGRRISDDLAAAGHAVEGTSVESFVRCD